MKLFLSTVFLFSFFYSNRILSQVADPVTSKESIRPTGVSMAFLEDGTIKEFEQFSELLEVKQRVVSIQIQNKHLSVIPDELQQFPKLELIDVSHNQISEIDAQFFTHLKKLRKLYINQNPVSKEDLAKFAAEFPHIEIISSNNQFN